MVYWFFGYPGAGKDYCADILSQVLNCPHIDADDFLTSTDRNKLIKGTFTKEDRIKKLARVIRHAKKLLKNNKDLTIADSLPDNKSRKFVLDSFIGNITFVLVEVSPKIHLKRIENRENHFFTKELLENWIKRHWEEIEIPYIKLKNNNLTNDTIRKYFKKII